MKAIVTIELEVDNDIDKKYPNFIYNYDSVKDFLLREIASYNEKLKFEDVNVLINYHSSCDDPSYIPDDIRYRTKVLNYKITEQ